MRIVPATVALTICLFITQCVVMGVPEVASAEWQAASRPCDVLPGALLPQPVYWFPAGEPAMAPMGYFTDSGPGGMPPASDFTATAVWGDGATSPATIEQGGVSGCYAVFTPEHRYESVGTFSFDYDVHDAQTGLDHTLAATELHTWSLVPHPLGNQSSQTIHATVGTPWSGVVGEFGLEGNGLYLPYTAQIDWGDGESPTAGTISHSGNTIAVSGTITYRQPFSGTIGVQVWHGSRLLGTWTTSSVDAVETVPDLVPPAPFQSVHVQHKLAIRQNVHLTFRAKPLPEGGYYYGVIVLKRYKKYTRSSPPPCSTSSNMQRTDYGYPRPNGQVALALTPGHSPTGHWCPSGAYEGAVYAVPHAPPCESTYPCRSEPYTPPSPCWNIEGHRVCGVVARPKEYAYPGVLPRPRATGTTIVARFSVKFPR